MLLPRGDLFVPAMAVACAACRALCSELALAASHWHDRPCGRRYTFGDYWLDLCIPLWVLGEVAAGASHAYKVVPLLKSSICFSEDVMPFAGGA